MTDDETYHLLADDCTCPVCTLWRIVRGEDPSDVETITTAGEEPAP